MLYLAQIQKPRYQKPKLQLLAYQRKDTMWVALSEPQSKDLGTKYDYLHDGVTVIVEFDPENQQLIKLSSGLGELLRSLQDWSIKLNKFEKQQTRIVEWNNSLKYQAEELHRRESIVQTKETWLQEESTKLREWYRVLQAKVKDLESDRALVKKELELIERDKSELAKAWEQVIHRQSE